MAFPVGCGEVVTEYIRLGLRGNPVITDAIEVVRINRAACKDHTAHSIITRRHPVARRTRVRRDGLPVDFTEVIG